MIKTVAITGGIGSGKSVVCSYLSGKGVDVYDSDRAVRVLYDENHLLKQSVTELFGTGLLCPDGSLNRKKLASLVFADVSALEKLESVVHPALLADFISWRKSVYSSSVPWCGYGPVPFVVIESAIILEKPLFRGLADKIILVDAPLYLRRKRAEERDGVSPEMIGARIECQKLMNDFSNGIGRNSMVDALIMNDSGKDSLFRKVDEAFEGLWK
ncbi:MAG: dephospho-CoA kinase [Bacteroidales bacterium]|jgi:dephospho-CoA kinase|nr:dephospho-CoA kinase [Bacteroidales bacterium]MCI1786146.1 dephospho-CoA kinase [Bacteroidales bacterium]